VISSSCGEFVVIVGFEGDKAIETNVAVTVIFVEPLTVPMEAVIVVVPTLKEFTIPALPAALPMLATFGEEEFQVTD
jgi:hypothetical protein